jgi:hypothetical protein
MKTCHNLSIHSSGSGLSKKIAKRQAATNLLNMLENLGPEEKKALLNRAEGQVSTISVNFS